MTYGDLITVLVDGSCHKAHVAFLQLVGADLKSGQFRYFVHKLSRGSVRDGVLDTYDEGITWALGCDTPEAKALKAVAAL